MFFLAAVIYDRDLDHLEIRGDGQVVLDDIKALGLTSLFKTVEIFENVNTISSYAFTTCTNLESVIINSSLEIIDTYAFYQLGKLSTIILGSSLKIVKSYAFQFSGLVTLTIPASCETIDTLAFSYIFPLKNLFFEPNSKLKEIMISSFYQTSIGGHLSLPESVITLGGSAFRNCKIESVFIGKNVERIDDGPFHWCSQLQNISVDAENKNWTSIGGVLFSFDKKILKQFPGGKGGVYEIPSFVETVQSQSFTGNGVIEEITGGSNVKTFGKQAFRYCISLQKVAISSTLRTVGKGCFENSNLTRFHIPKTLKMEVGAFGGNIYMNMTVEEGHLSYVQKDNGIIYSNPEKDIIYCPGWLKNVEILDTVQTLPQSFFIGYINMETIKLPNNLVLMEEYSLERTGLTEVLIPASCQTLRAGVFQGSIKLTKITFESGSKVTVLPYQFCQNSKMVKEIIFEEPSIVSTFDIDAFKNCTNLDTISFPSTLNNIKTGCFYDCNKLKELKLSGNINVGERIAELCAFEKIELNIEVIGSYSFQNVVGEFRLYLLEKTKEIKIGSFLNCNNIIEIVFSKLITDLIIESEGFSRCNKIKEVLLPNLKILSSDSFAFCSELENISFLTGIENLNLNYLSKDGIIYNSNYSIFLICPGGRKEVNMEDKVITVGEMSFLGCEKLISVKFGSKVEVISKKCFYSCKSLNNVNIPKNTKIIGENAFEGCSSLKTVFYCLSSDKINTTGDPIPTDTEIIVPNTYTENFFLKTHKVIKSNSVKSDGCPNRPTDLFTIIKGKTTKRSSIFRFQIHFLFCGINHLL